MTVKELRDKLAEFPETSEVRICYDGAYVRSAIEAIYQDADDPTLVLLDEDEPEVTV